MCQILSLNTIVNVNNFYFCFKKNFQQVFLNRTKVVGTFDMFWVDIIRNILWNNQQTSYNNENHQMK